MFDHLDDPDPYVPGDGLRPAVERRARAIKRRRRAVLGGVAASVVVAAGVAGALGTQRMVEHELEQVETIDVPNLRTTQEPGDPKVVLFVGVDSDEGLDGANRTGPFRGDTMLLARVDPGNETLTVLPIPRDLLVDIPGQGQGRINEAIAAGGPGLLIDTIHQNLGIEVDHYLQADFHGAVAIGEALGGLRLSFPSAVRDLHTGFEANAGCAEMDGAQLLALARSRHLDYLEDGTWRRDPTSDLGRMERQQAIGAALLAQMAEVDASDPRELDRLLDAAVDDLTIDDDTTPKELLGLFRAIEGSTYGALRYPVVDHVTDGGAQVLLLGDASADVTAAFLGIDQPQPPRAPTTETTGAGEGGSSPAATSTTAAAATTTTSVPSSTPARSVPTPC
ncbi:MAG TPA: LCP family protein [Acidimicrobiales bacterium]|nr:LCP family protein [Acidimicrobiales bacterium]